MFIEPTFSTMLHKALTGKTGAKQVMPSFPEDGQQVAIYDDQGREVPNRRAWNDFEPTLKREPRKVAN